MPCGRGGVFVYGESSVCNTLQVSTEKLVGLTVLFASDFFAKTVIGM